MRFSRLILKNWRNFVHVDLKMQERLFITGPNASGKSNLLDVFRFLRDIAKDGGGLQAAVRDRGGLSKIRCLAARRHPSYNGTLGMFVSGRWDPRRAARRCNSLARLLRALDDLEARYWSP
jgi:hypothetical protein